MLDTKEEFAALSSVLAELGIGKGDVLYVASDITRLMYHMSRIYGIETGKEYDEYLHGLVDTLQQASGTLLFPVFTWAFCRGRPFSVRESKGEVGALNNWVLKNRKDFVRTQHPMYSFMVWGKDANLLVRMENRDAWGEDSPFAYFRERNAKTLMIDVPPGKCFTFMHYVERYLNVPWRYRKDFVGSYIDYDGHTSRRKYSMYVRDLAIQSEQVQDTKTLEGCGILKRKTWADLDLWYMTCQDAFPIYVEDIRKNGAKMCYRFDNYTPDWTSGQTHADVLITKSGE